MVKRIVIPVLLACVATLAFAQAYKWVDENGVVHYSDRPHPGAEEFVLPDSPRRPRIVPAPSTADADDRGSREATPESTSDGAYTAIEVIAPAAEETLWNIEGTLEVRLNVQPALKKGHQIRVYIDGEPTIVNSTTFTIPEVYRGAHNIQAEILDATGRSQIRSATSRFYVQQNSVAGSSRPGAYPR